MRLDLLVIDNVQQTIPPQGDVLYWIAENRLNLKGTSTDI